MFVDHKSGRKLHRTLHDEVLQNVQQKLDRCRHGFIFRNVELEFVDGTLTLNGCVPSFYLKQNLQELLRNTPHVEQIVCNVDVVSSCGMSSVRKAK
ncbi:BON domain-containing protein [Blastopirellula sp. JC732]|uniref:BON domain-containing protein n=1 Tax=Blastopirellula sediminis TaxID=2894196 RepID=A0A9X1ML73_9BACT|nr:BON domain-containing protein [Blastopirellula sediminis]MCC9608327.1 BON domain-containing protein [Blastopirellula sediminis]MCC9628896.1 BON domain-containing protein [Blastopirellula sediminis]